VGLGEVLVLVVAQQPLEDVVALADVGQRPRRIVRVGTDEQVDAGARTSSLLLSWSSWERGATSTLPVQLLISARRTPVGSPSARKMRMVLPVILPPPVLQTAS